MAMKRRADRKDGMLTAAAAILILFSVVFVVWMNRKVNDGINLDGIAFADLKASNENHKEYVNELMQREYGALHSLAFYFENKEDFDFRNELDLVNSIMLADHYKSIGYADLNGNVIGAEGAACKNIADSQWFQKAASWKGYDAIEFLFPDEDHVVPHIHMASPVRKRSNLIGILYVCVDAADFKEMLTAGYFNKNEVVFIADSQGNIILSNENDGKHIFGTNLFDIHPDAVILDQERSERILRNMANGIGGQFRVNHGELEYVVYSPLDFGGWTIFSVVPSSVVSDRFHANMEQVEGIMRALTMTFLAAMALVCAIVVFSSLRNRKHLRRLKQQENVILSSLMPLTLSANLTQNTHRMISCSQLDLQCAMDGGSYDDFICHMSEHIHEEDREAFLAAFSREELLKAFAVGQHVINFPHRLVDDSGKLRWHIGRCVMVHDETDGDIHLTLVLIDNTEQMEQQKKLQRQYDLTIENMPAYTGKWIFKDGDMYLIGANQRYLDFMGGSAEELFHKSVVYGFDKKEKTVLLSKLYASVMKRESISLTHSAVTYDGKCRILDIQASYFEEVEGNPVYFGVLTDVTELVMTEEKLRKIQTDLQVTVDHFVHTILEYNIVDQTMRLISGGDSRIDIDKAISKYPESLFQSGVFEPESFEKIYQFFETLHMGKNSGPLPLTICCNDGTKLFVETTGTIVHNPVGAPTMAMVILTKTGEIAGNGEPELEQTSRSAKEALDTEKKVFAKTFGHFDLFLNDKPLYFTNAKAKELLAILIDRRGGTLTSSEAISILWEDEPAGDKQLARYRKLASRLKETLESAGCGEILVSNNGIRSIDVSKLSCDCYQAMDGDASSQKLYEGFYMSGYSWAEERNASLNRMFGIDNSEY